MDQSSHHKAHIGEFIDTLLRQMSPPRFKEAPDCAAPASDKAHLAIYNHCGRSHAKTLRLHHSIHIITGSTMRGIAGDDLEQAIMYDKLKARPLTKTTIEQLQDTSATKGLHRMTQQTCHRPIPAIALIIRIRCCGILIRKRISRHKAARRSSPVNNLLDLGGCRPVQTVRRICRVLRAGPVEAAARSCSIRSNRRSTREGSGGPATQLSPQSVCRGNATSISEQRAG